jgi:BRO1-like domain
MKKQAIVITSDPDENSSKVTSLVAVYTSDLYDVSLRNATASHKQKFEKSWISYIKSKCQLFGAIAHFHTGPQVSSDRAVAERMTRLEVAKQMVHTSHSYSEKVGGILHDIVTVPSSNVSDTLK